MSACRKKGGTSIGYYCSEPGVIESCANDPSRALELMAEAFADKGIACDGMREVMTSKLEADMIAAKGEHAAALSAYVTAIETAPQGFLAAEIAASSAANEPIKPPKLKGLPPSRRAALVRKERERTTPGRVRWLYSSLLGRGRAALASTATDATGTAAADARAAAALCPLDPEAWQLLAAAATAAGDAALAADADLEVARRTPEQ